MSKSSHAELGLGEGRLQLKETAVAQERYEHTMRRGQERQVGPSKGRCAGNGRAGK